jgi:hypothetical protein
MPLYPNPDVPDVSGVPAVPRSGDSTTSTSVSLGKASTAITSALQQKPLWGIFSASTSAVAGAQLGNSSTLLSTGSVDYIKEMIVSDFPIEDGGFASYNKVEKPATPIVTLILGGTKDDRSAFLSAIDAAVKSTNLYNVVTPEYTFTNCTLGKYSYRRAPERGANMMAVSIPLTEIRTVTATYTKTGINNPKSASASSQVSSGSVQTSTPSSATTAALKSKLNETFVANGDYDFYLW